MLKVTLTQLIMTCSLATSSHKADVEETLYKIVTASSYGAQGGVTQTVTVVEDATTRARYEPTSSHKAAALASGLLAEGHALRLGLTSLHSDHWATYRQPTPRAFTACANIQVASIVLDELFMRHPPTRRKSLHRALAAYHDPQAPQSFDAIEWGAMVMATPCPPRSAWREERGKPGPYTLKRSLFFHAPAPAPENDGDVTTIEEVE